VCSYGSGAKGHPADANTEQESGSLVGGRYLSWLPSGALIPGDAVRTVFPGRGLVRCPWS
jgi:hypothetical protein